MNKNVEYEDRIMISQNDYEKIIKEFDINDQIKQKNIYFDNKDLFLTKSHQVLRLRIINDDIFELTLKVNKGEYCDEFNQIINKEEADNFINNFIFPNKKVEELIISTGIDVTKLNVVGDITTYRIEKEVDNYLLVLDKNEYSNITDYNLEVEANDFKKAHEIIMDYVNKYNLIYSKDYVSKSKRAIKAHLRLLITF